MIESAFLFVVQHIVCRAERLILKRCYSFVGNSPSRDEDRTDVESLGMAEVLPEGVC